MKYILFTICLALCAACGKNSESTEEGAKNTEENVEEMSGENISPQLKDSTNRFNVDTISSSSEAQQEKENELEDGTSTNDQ